MDSEKWRHEPLVAVLRRADGVPGLQECWECFLALARPPEVPPGTGERSDSSNTHQSSGPQPRMASPTLSARSPAAESIRVQPESINQRRGGQRRRPCWTDAPLRDRDRAGYSRTVQRVY
ncbi:hypothetical protein SKAU_G00307310 [Synaphobranchus kaupii]|uniref:Uncharacterized protein n=1 Tax=Synaphobranchus kaupii TaxID=118154 RepID=A0A9Q1ER04_SYNKA|nr:hypothetical protein SKAU_G00307310 [Synaphobranchus kaupii]